MYSVYPTMGDEDAISIGVENFKIIQEWRHKIYSLCLHLNRVVTLQVQVPDGVDG